MFVFSVMVHTLWILACAVVTSHCSLTNEDRGQTTTLIPDSETTLENIHTSNTTEIYQLEETSQTTSNSIEIDDNSSSELKQYIHEVLLAHNEYRSLYGVPSLQLNNDLNKRSQLWANHLAEVNTIENSFSEYGENIYVETINSNKNGSSAVKYWYDKNKFYVPGNLTNDWWNAATFTQLIWAKSKDLGVGMSENNQFRFVVCFYDPVGNIIGQDPLGTDDYPELPSEETFFILPGGVFREGNENENLTSSVLEKIIKEVLDAHNYYRALHGVQPLELQEELNEESQAWADELANTNTFHHSTSLNGENIYKEPIYFDRNGTSPVKVWYDEIEFYKFGKEPEDWHIVGHFTQLIWANTTFVGVGLSENDETRFIVCNYNPRGNIVNQSHYETFIPQIVHENKDEEISVTELNTQEDINATSTFLEDFRKEVLETHNHFRTLHGVHPLALKDELNAMSQKRADNLAANNSWTSNSSHYAENIYVATVNSVFNGSVPVHYWYHEIKYYTFGKKAEDWLKIVHFTQLIWGNTTDLGVGLAQNDNMRFVVCSYDPHGNMMALINYLRTINIAGGINVTDDGNVTEDTFPSSSIQEFFKTFNNYIQINEGHTNNVKDITLTKTTVGLRNQTIFDFQAAINNSEIINTFIESISEISYDNTEM